jgi:hypothetical protein
MIFRRACVKLPGDRLPWWAVVNMVMDPGGSIKAGDAVTSLETLKLPSLSQDQLHLVKLRKLQT